ncbi:hypothetical protein AB0F81_44710 [Actinoplanes sp. NPDC024001]|uniref:hypothetical protein n=1 Tax=Actinoplanes sp. NPDC024001 TaxID=3154598 RepID=UPI0033C55D8C
MSTPPAVPRGLFHAVAAGYLLAWHERRRLLAVQLPIVAVLLAGSLALELAAGWRNGVLVDGRLLVDDDAGGYGLARSVLVAACWLIALTAGMLALTGVDRPVRSAVRRVPAVVAGVALTAVVSWLVLRILPNWFGLLVAFALVGLVGAHLLLVMVVTGPSLMAAAAVLVGGLVAVLIPGWLAGVLPAGTPALIADAVEAAVVIVAVAAQAGVVAIHALPAPSGPPSHKPASAGSSLEGVPSPPSAEPSPDASEPTSAGSSLGGVPSPPSAGPSPDEVPEPTSTRPSPGGVSEPASAGPSLGGVPEPGSPGTRNARFLWPAIVAVALPILITGAVAVINPFGAFEARTTDGPPWGAAAVAWPAGQHPVIVTMGEVRFCDTDLCDSFTSHDGGPPVHDGYGTAGIGTDGTAVTAALTGGENDGGPFIHHARCTRDDGCREAWLPVRASARETWDPELGRPELATSAGPDGAAWFFVAIPASADRYRLALIRCPDTECAKPQRHDVGSHERLPEDGYRDGSRARLSIGADGRPVASLWSGHGVHQVTCGQVRKADVSGAPPEAVWAAPAALGQQVAALQPGRLQIEHFEPLENGVAAESGAVAVAGDTVYAAEAVTSTRQDGFHVTVGEAPQFWRQVLWRCTFARECHRVPLDVYEGPARREMLAPGPDGRVLIVREDRILLVDPTV